jgi:hypothetical protein
MSAKVYFLKFGSGSPIANSGLTPTFLQFFDSTGTTLAPPSITEIKYGGVTASGIYGFSYLIGISTANPIYFLAYSVTTVSSAIVSDQYISGVLDPVIAVDQQLTAQGTTLVGLGTSLNAISVSLGAQSASLGAQGTTFLAFGSTLLGIGQTSAATGVTVTAIGNTLLSLGTTLSFSFAGLGSTASSYGSTSIDPGDVFGYLKRIQELLEGDQIFSTTTSVWSMYNRGSTTLLRNKTLATTVSNITKSGQ